MSVSRNYKGIPNSQLIALEYEKREKFTSPIAFYYSYDRNVEILQNGIIHSMKGNNILSSNENLDITIVYAVVNQKCTSIICISKKNRFFLFDFSKNSQCCIIEINLQNNITAAAWINDYSFIICTGNDYTTKTLYSISTTEPKNQTKIGEIINPYQFSVLSLYYLDRSPLSPVILACTSNGLYLGHLNFFQTYDFTRIHNSTTYQVIFNNPYAIFFSSSGLYKIDIFTSENVGNPILITPISKILRAFHLCNIAPPYPTYSNCIAYVSGHIIVSTCKSNRIIGFSAEDGNPYFYFEGEGLDSSIQGVCAKSQTSFYFYTQYSLYEATFPIDYHISLISHNLTPLSYSQSPKTLAERLLTIYQPEGELLKRFVNLITLLHERPDDAKLLLNLAVEQYSELPPENIVESSTLLVDALSKFQDVIPFDHLFYALLKGGKQKEISRFINIYGAELPMMSLISQCRFPIGLVANLFSQTYQTNSPDPYFNNQDTTQYSGTLQNSTNNDINKNTTQSNKSKFQLSTGFTYLNPFIRIADIVYIYPQLAPVLYKALGETISGLLIRVLPQITGRHLRQLSELVSGSGGLLEAAIAEKLGGKMELHGVREPYWMLDEAKIKGNWSQASKLALELGLEIEYQNCSQKIAVLSDLSAQLARNNLTGNELNQLLLQFYKAFENAKPDQTFSDFSEFAKELDKKLNKISQKKQIQRSKDIQVIEKLFHQKQDIENKEFKVNSDVKCSYCNHKLGHGNTFVFPCGHVFHEDCKEKLFRNYDNIQEQLLRITPINHDTCPLCGVDSAISVHMTLNSDDHQKNNWSLDL